MRRLSEPVSPRGKRGTPSSMVYVTRIRRVSSSRWSCMQPTDGYRKTQDGISYLKNIAEEAIQLTEFFDSGPGPHSRMLKKRSVSRPFTAYGFKWLNAIQRAIPRCDRPPEWRLPDQLYRLLGPDQCSSVRLWKTHPWTPAVRPRDRRHAQPRI